MRSYSRTINCFRSLLTISALLVSCSEGRAQATATLLRPRTRHSAWLITIALAGFLWLIASAETAAAFAQADVAHSTLKGNVTDQFDAAVSGATITVINAGRGDATSAAMFDWRELKRWGISESRLPPGSIVRFRVPSFWDEYKWYAIAVSSVVIVQSLLIMGLVINRTRRKLAEEALRESEERFRGIYEHAPMGIAITDWQLYFQQCNTAYCAMLGYTEEELRHKVCSELVHPDDRDANLAEVRLLMAGELPFFEIDNRYVCKDGELVWVHKFVSILRDEKGAPEYLLALVTDITARKRAEEALRESEERFRNMADTAPVMIWISGADKLCTYFNQQWLNFTGRTTGEELGNGWARGVHPDDYERCLETYSTAFNKREPFRMEYRLRRVDGQFRWIIDSGTARFSPSGEFLGYIGSCIDITERKAAEESLADLSGQLIRARENERARIARELHDDLNQRMALISIDLEQLGLNPPATNGSLRGQLEGILKQAGDVSREIHRISYDLHPSKLTQLGLVAAVTSLCDDARSSHQLKIEFLHEGVPADLPREVSLCLYRIAQECLNNVIKHSGAAEAKVELHGNANEFRLRVSDSGKGFDVESTRIRNGLGLKSMRERLRLVGGRISIVSRAPSGTQIDATVPLGQLTVDYEDHSPDERRRAVPG